MNDESADIEPEPEEIRLQMEQTRSDLSEKLAELETQVAETIQSTRTAIDSTVTSIRGAVVNVKESLSLRHQIEQHPLVALGGAVAVGFLAESLIAKATRPAKATNVRLVNPIPEEYQATQTTPQPTLMNTLQGLVQNAAIQSLPLVFNFLMQQWTAPRDSPQVPPDDSPDRSTVPMSEQNASYNSSPVSHIAV